MTATSVRETEWKYEAPSGRTAVPDLTELPRVAAQADDGRQTLSAVYYDTDDLLLARSGITLRRRVGGEDAGWHLKLPEHPGSRTEIRLPVSDQLPDELTGLVTAWLRGRPVQPVAHITTHRRRAVLLDELGVSMAEIVADDVIAEALGESRAADRWSEVEVELTGGDDRLLRAADKRLHKRGLVRSERASKLERALGERLAAARSLPAKAKGGKKSAPTAGDVVCEYIRTQRDELMRQDPRVRMAEPEAVHDMRVAARRLRSALQAFDGVLRPRDTGGIVKDLRWLGRTLGRMRDDEIIAERLESGLSRLPSDLPTGPIAGRIADRRPAHPEALQTAVRRTLDSERYLSLLDALDELLAAPPLASGAQRPAAKALPKAVKRAFKRVQRRATAAFAAEPGKRQDLALHATRKAAKRARYAAEAAQLALDKKPVRKTIKGLTKLQSALGDHQDTVVARQSIRELGAEAHAAGENAFAYGLMYEREARQATESREHARKAWHKASRANRTRWMTSR
jgi:CHAD domain-containing protein